MKHFFLFTVFFISFTKSFCQVNSYTINPGETYAQKIPLSEIYAYPEFKTGYVIMKDNTGSTVRLNYNRLYQEIVFIDPSSNDTLALASPEMVKVVQVNNDEFYYATDRFVQVDTTINEIKLAVANYFTESKEKEVGYGKRVESGSISSQAYMLPSSTSHIGQRLDLSPNDIVTLYPKKALLIIDENRQVHEISKKQLYKVFAKDENKLKEYLAENKPSFKSREDLINLIKYMTSDK